MSKTAQEHAAKILAMRTAVERMDQLAQSPYNLTKTGDRARALSVTLREQGYRLQRIPAKQR